MIQKIKKLEKNNGSTRFGWRIKKRQLPLLTEPNQKEVIKSKNEVKSRNKNNQCCQKALTTRKGFKIKDSPRMTKLSINRSTEVATDIYSRKYPIIWVQ